MAVHTDDAGRISTVEPLLGLVHRSDEKLFASRDYRQLLVMAGRHAWFTSLHGELVAVLAIEEAMGITPSAHATWSRMLLAELDRIQASLLLCDTDAAREVREHALAVMELATGNRVHPMAMRIGGIGQQLDTAVLARVEEFLDALNINAIAAEVRAHAHANAGVGVLDHDTARGLGATGPVGQASGIDLDVRVAMPYLAYAEATPQSAVFTEGDVPARYEALISSMIGAAEIMRTCVTKIAAHAGEPVSVTLPKTIKVPVGTTFASVESPLGMLTAMLVAEGDRVPARMALRTPSFANLQAMAKACEGAELDDLDPILRSFMIGIGEVER